MSLEVRIVVHETRSLGKVAKNDTKNRREHFLHSFLLLFPVFVASLSIRAQALEDLGGDCHVAKTPALWLT
jgi:hypothetical protein